jgi:hypothetical protein
MLAILAQALRAILTTVRISSSITAHTPHLSDGQRLEYAWYIASAADELEVDPFLIAAVMWHESWFMNLPQNRTNDYGLMQVHWQRVPWLEGLTRRDLMDPKINIYAGVRELAYMRKFCRARKDQGHEWWSHYKYGVVVSSTVYGSKIRLKRQVLVNHRPRPSKPQS